MLKIRIVSSYGEIKGEYCSSEIKYIYKGEYSEGDRIEISSDDSKYLSVKPNFSMKESVVYIPDGVFVFPIPFGDGREAYLADSWSGNSHEIFARVPTDEEIYSYRNIAMNSSDYSAADNLFPHASANFVTGDGLAAYSARNAIDGETKNDSHGRYPNHSYSGGKREDIVFDLDFGQKVQIDKIVLYLRADFPHDTYWKSLVFEFSDKSTLQYEPEMTGTPQVISVSKITDNIRIKDFKQAANPLSFAALSEIEVYGKIIQNN